MSLTYAKLKGKVHKKISKLICDDIFTFLKQQEIRLWGEKKPRDFLQKMMYIVLYKDLSGKGANRMEKLLSPSIRWNHKSILHNSKVLRVWLAEWGKTKIREGSPEEWKEIARRCDLRRPVADANLWIDSTDVGLEGKRRVSQRSQEWSFKTNRPAQ